MKQAQMNPKPCLYYLVRALNLALSGCILLCCLFFGYIYYCNVTGMPAPKLGPVSLYVVISDSMVPAFRTGDAIFVAEVEPETLEVGDIIAFYAFEENVTITHRIIAIQQTAEGRSFRTQGDNNNVADSFTTPESKLIGKYLFQIPRLNRYIERIQRQPYSVIVPMLLLVAVQGMYVVLEKMWKPSEEADNPRDTEGNPVGEGEEPDE